MRTPTGSLQRAALLVCALLVLTACSDDPPPAGSLPSGTPSTTSSSAVPTLDTPEEQVEAAVRAYYAELTRAAQTNDTSRLRTMTTKGCPCYRAVKVIENNEAKGRTTPAASFEIAELRVHDIEGATASAEVRTDEVAYDVLNARSETIGTVPRRSHFLDLSLVLKGDGQWIIANEFNLRGDA